MLASRIDSRASAAVIGAGLLIAAFWSAGEAAGRYLILYGRHGWGPPEAAFLLNYVLLGVPAAGLVTIALARWCGRWLDERFEGLPARPRVIGPRGAWLAAILVGVLITLARYALLRDTAITDDENVYDFMARVWAGGRLVATSPPPAVRPFFENQFIVNDGRWYGIYAPGHILMLALGQWLGAIRWVTTIEAILTVPVAWALARRLYGERAGALTGGFLVLSPFFVLVSATMLSHSTATLALSSFAYAAVRVLDDPRTLRWWAAAGGALGYAGLTRPLTAAAFVVPWLVLLGRAALRDREARRGAGLFAVLGGAAIALYLGYNAAVTGHPLRTGYHVFAETYGFSFTQGSLPVSAPFAALYELYYALARLNFWLLGWPLSLVLVPFALRARASRALALSALATVVAYALLRIPSINVVGPVHYAELTVPLLVLSAGGLERLAASATALAGRRGPRLVLSLPIALTTVSALLFWPVYAPALRWMAGVARAPYDLVERAGLDNAVVFVGTLPALVSPPGAWVYRVRNNTPDLSDRVLYVNDLGPDNARLRRMLPGRRAYHLRMEGDVLRLSPLAP
jgi:hypothetical protein